MKVFLFLWTTIGATVNAELKGVLMKKASMVLGIVGGVIGLIISVMYINISADGINMSGPIGGMYLRQFIFGIIGATGAVSALIGAAVVLKKKELSAILMFTGAISGLYTLPGIFTCIILLLAGIFVFVKGKSPVPSSDIHTETAVQANEDLPACETTSEKGKTGIVLGIVFGIVLLFISYFLICLTFLTDTRTPADPVLYEEMMEDAARCILLKLF